MAKAKSKYQERSESSIKAIAQQLYETGLSSREVARQVFKKTNVQRSHMWVLRNVK